MSLVLTCFLTIGIYLETNQNPIMTYTQNNTPEQYQIEQAGWFFGWHSKNGRKLFRVFGITLFGRNKCNWI